MSDYGSKGSSTNVDINLDQDFDIDYVNDRRSTKKEYEVDKDIDVNVKYETDVEHTHTKGYKVGFELETEHTKTDNYNKNVDIEIDKSTETISDTFILDVTKKVTETIDVNQTLTEDWNVHVNVHAENIIQNSHVNSDEDINDLDISKLIDVSKDAEVKMQDFNLDMSAIGDSFNGAGNDSVVSVNQSNNLVDNDEVKDTSVTYQNDQKPNIEAYVDADASHSAGYHAGNHGYGHIEKDYDWKGGVSGGYGYGSWWGASAAASASLVADISVKAPTDAFQTVTGDGGTAYAGDGISHADIDNVASDNEGNGSVGGNSEATADGVASADAFTSSIMAGGNQQANFSTLNVIGGNSLDAGDVKGGHHPSQSGGSAAAEDDDGGLAIKDSKVNLDDDLNDLDASELINVDGMLTMDDFNLDVDAIASSFNGPGNDMAFDVNQSNDLVDNDTVYGTQVGYTGTGWNGPFQSVTAWGGHATAGDGIGSIHGHGIANSNGGNGSLLGSTAASADALATAEAFTSNIVVGANLQVNNLSASIVGGDSTVVDDIGLGY